MKIHPQYKNLRRPETFLWKLSLNVILSLSLCPTFHILNNTLQHMTAQVYMCLGIVSGKGKYNCSMKTFYSLLSKERDQGKPVMIKLFSFPPWTT